MMLTLLLALQEATIPDGYEIVTGPFYDGKNVRYVARDTASGAKIVQIGKTTHDYLKVVVVTDNKTGLDVVQGLDKIENPVFIDGQLVAYEAKKGKATIVVVRGEKYEIPEGRMILDRKSGWYVIPKGANKVFVAGEKVGPDCDGIDGQLRVSPDGKSVVYKATIGNDACLFLDGKKIVGLQFWDWGFSPAGEPYYLASPKTKDGGVGDMTLTVGQKKGAPFQGSVPAIQWGADGKTPILKLSATVEGRTRPYFLFLNRSFPDFEEVDSPIVSPDGKSLAYRAKITTNLHVVINDKKGPGFAELGMLAWSPDSKRVVYAAKSGTSWCVVDGEKKSGEWGQISWVGVNPKTGQVAYVAEKDTAWHFVEGTTVSAAFRAVGTPRYSADGTPWYDAHDGNKYMLFRGAEVAADSTGPIGWLGQGAWKIAIDQKPAIVFADGTVGPFEAIPTVIPGGKAIVFVGTTKEKETVHIGKNAVQEAEKIYDVRLVDDGKKVRIFYRQGIELRVVKVPLP